MFDLNELFLYAKVVEHGGFAAAGRALNLPKSTLSRRVSQLEARLGARRYSARRASSKSPISARPTTATAWR